MEPKENFAKTSMAMLEKELPHSLPKLFRFIATNAKMSNKNEQMNPIIRLHLLYLVRPAGACFNG